MPSEQTTPTAQDADPFQSFDAQVWAREFVRMVREKPDIATDEGTMLGWFANALMRGYDHHAWKHADALRDAERLETLRDSVRTLSGMRLAHSPDEYVLREDVLMLLDAATLADGGTDQ